MPAAMQDFAFADRERLTRVRLALFRRESDQAVSRRLRLFADHVADEVGDAILAAGLAVIRGDGEGSAAENGNRADCRRTLTERAGASRGERVVCFHGSQGNASKREFGGLAASYRIKGPGKCM